MEDLLQPRPLEPLPKKKFEWKNVNWGDVLKSMALSMIALTAFAWIMLQVYIVVQPAANCKMGAELSSMVTECEATGGRIVLSCSSTPYSFGNYSQQQVYNISRVS